jgi:hypothetical protein
MLILILFCFLFTSTDYKEVTDYLKSEREIGRFYDSNIRKVGFFRFHMQIEDIGCLAIDGCLNSVV